MGIQRAPAGKRSPLRCRRRPIPIPGPFGACTRRDGRSVRVAVDGSGLRFWGLVPASRSQRRSTQCAWARRLHRPARRMDPAGRIDRRWDPVLLALSRQELDSRHGPVDMRRLLAGPATLAAVAVHAASRVSGASSFGPRRKSSPVARPSLDPPVSAITVFGHCPIRALASRERRDRLPEPASRRRDRGLRGHGGDLSAFVAAGQGSASASLRPPATFIWRSTRSTPEMARRSRISFSSCLR